jgi:hypothetical protein
VSPKNENKKLYGIDANARSGKGVASFNIHQSLNVENFVIQILIAISQIITNSTLTSTEYQVSVGNPQIPT